MNYAPHSVLIAFDAARFGLIIPGVRKYEITRPISGCGNSTRDPAASYF
jgi:hypothetical protein